jgi:hypothetical protein
MPDMKHLKNSCLTLLAITLGLFSTLSAGEELKRAWQTAACFHFSLSVWDKKGQGRYAAKYVVTSGDGRVFIATKNASDDPNTAEVIFPDSFLEKNTNQKAWVNCSFGENYSWEIYANGTLIENGNFVISRKKTKVRNLEHLGNEITRTYL